MDEAEGDAGDAVQEDDHEVEDGALRLHAHLCIRCAYFSLSLH